MPDLGTRLLDLFHMKSFLLILLGCASLAAQPISVGVKGGLPLTEFVDTFSDGGVTLRSSNHLIIGPSVELRLPGGIGVELDALYRRFNYNANSSVVNSILHIDTSGNHWEFPLLLKKRLGGEGPVHPFVAAGFSFSKLSGLKSVVTNPQSTLTLNQPAELKNDFATGVVIGGGIDIKALLIHIIPEIRFTRWNRDQIDGTIIPTRSLSSNRNQAEFLIGVTF